MFKQKQQVTVGEQTKVEYVEHIWKEVRRARGRLSDLFANPCLDMSSCIDQEAKKAQQVKDRDIIRIPGGMLMVWSENQRLMKAYLRLHTGKKIKVYLHKYCGYLYTVHQCTTVRSQMAYLDRFMTDFERHCRCEGVTVEFVIDDSGSAKPYMTQ